jgi:hypothetical protein
MDAAERHLRDCAMPNQLSNRNILCGPPPVWLATNILPFAPERVTRRAEYDCALRFI